MTTTTRNRSALAYFYLPLLQLWYSLERYMKIVGYARAANELARLGYHAQARCCNQEQNKL